MIVNNTINTENMTKLHRQCVVVNVSTHVI